MKFDRDDSSSIRTVQNVFINHVKKSSVHLAYQKPDYQSSGIQYSVPITTSMGKSLVLITIGSNNIRLPMAVPHSGVDVLRHILEIRMVPSSATPETGAGLS
jgi:hypothetical protein